MTPYVIDEQKQNQIAIILIIALAVSFALGYAFGFQNAMIDRSDEPAPISENAPLAETTASQAAESIPLAEQPEQTEPVNKADEPTEQKKNSPAPEKKTVKAETSKTPVVAVKPPPVVAKPVKLPAVTKAQEVKAKPEIVRKPEPVPLPVAQQSSPELKNTQQLDITVSTDEVSPGTQLTDKTQRYSIQAGMFESRDNALKFIDELKVSGFEAYLSDFVSSGGSVKYNVRFGGFEERQQVENELAAFKQKFSSPAYIIINK